MALRPRRQQFMVAVLQQHHLLLCWGEQWRLQTVASHCLMLHLYFTITILLAKLWELVCIVTLGHNMTIIPIVFNLLVTKAGEIMAVFDPSTVYTKPATGT